MARFLVVNVTFICILLGSAVGAYAAWAPSARGLVVGAGLGFTSGPVASSGGDAFAGVGGYVFVGRELADIFTLGGKFEGYVYKKAPYDYSYGSAVDQIMYQIGVSSRLYPVAFFGLRPYVGGDAGIYIRVNRENTAETATFGSIVEPGLTGRTGLEVFMVNSVAVDFGAAYSIDAAERNRLRALGGYVGAVVYF